MAAGWRSEFYGEVGSRFEVAMLASLMVKKMNCKRGCDAVIEGFDFAKVVIDGVCLGRIRRACGLKKELALVAGSSGGQKGADRRGIFVSE